MMKFFMAVILFSTSYVQYAVANTSSLQIEDVSKSVFYQKIRYSQVKLQKEDNIIKKNNSIALPFFDGKIWVLADNPGVPNADYQQTYQYEGTISDLNLYVIKVNSFENSSYLLVDKKTGEWEIANSIPILSQDKTKAVTVSINPYEEYEISPPTLDLIMFNVHSQQLKPIFSGHYPWKNNFEVKNVFWLHDEIYIEGIDINNNSIYKVVRLTD